jgi:hypothetical protein
MTSLGEQTERLQAGDLAEVRQRVTDGQQRRKQARSSTASDVMLALGNTEKRMYARSGAMLKGKKATYAAEKKAKKAADDEDEEEEDEEEEEVAEAKKKAPAAKGKGKAAAKKAAAKKQKTGKKHEEDDFIDDDDGESEEEYDEDESEDEQPKKRKAPAKKAAAGSRKDQAEEVDPWNVHSANVRNNWANLQAPPLEMFYWNRLVVDEYTYNTDRDQTAIVHGLKANARWVLSGTPNVSGFAAVSTIGEWLGLHLGSQDVSDLSKAQKAQQSAMERFQYFKDVQTPAWHAARHRQAPSLSPDLASISRRSHAPRSPPPRPPPTRSPRAFLPTSPCRRSSSLTGTCGRTSPRSTRSRGRSAR